MHAIKIAVELVDGEVIPVRMSDRDLNLLRANAREKATKVVEYGMWDGDRLIPPHRIVSVKLEAV